MLLLYHGDGPYLFPVDGRLQWVLGEAAARGQHFIRIRAPFDWLPVGLAGPGEG